MKLYSKKKKNPLKILILISLLIGLSFALSKHFLSKKIDDIVVAQIGEENIYKSEIERKIVEVFPNNQNGKINFEKLPEQVLEIFAREIYLDKKIVAEGKRLGLDNTLEVKNLIESFKNSTIRQAYINNSLKDIINDQKIVEKFNELNAELESKSEYKYLQIVVPDEKLAQNLFKDLKAPRKPMKFSEAVKKHSIDNQTNLNGGEVDYKIESSINSKILEALKSVKKDEVSLPFQVDELWYIVKLVDIKKSKPMEFESSKEYIRHVLKIEEIEKINGKFLKDNKIKLLIKKTANDPDIKPQSDDSKSEQNPSKNSEKPVENKDKEAQLLENSVDDQKSSESDQVQDKDSEIKLEPNSNETKQQKL